MGKLDNIGKKYGNTNFSESTSSIFESKDTSINGGVNCEANSQPRHPSSISEEMLMPMSWVNISKIIYEKDIHPIDILSVLYSAIHDSCKSVVLLIQKENFGKIQFYLGVRDNFKNSNFVCKYILQKALKGLLPGVVFEDVQVRLNEKLNGNFVSSVASVPALKNDKKSKFTQGLERLINAVIDIPSYSIILIADSLSEKNLNSRIYNLEEEYSELSDKAELTGTKSESKTTTTSESQTKGSNESTGESHTETITGNITASKSNAESKGNSLGIIAGGNESKSETKSRSTTSGSSVSQGNSKTVGLSTSHSDTKGSNVTKGTSEQVKKENKSVKNHLKWIDKDISRMLSAKASGLWNFNAYFVADNLLSVQSLGAIYKGLFTGTDSQNEFVNVISYDKVQSQEIIESLTNINLKREYKSNIYLNSDELAICMNFPQTSVPGVLVGEKVAFGRNIHYKDDIERECISLGCLHHLGCDDNQNKLEIDVNLLTSHMFVTGTTGSGKSNALYLLLSKLRDLGKTFMVIEPAKGEYKSVFGLYPDVNVFGVIPGKGNVLRINPFSFPNGIHVEEHIDRLIDIFNACWPMYAAMPQILKAAVSNAYTSCGWNLITSESEFGIFPTISDIIRELTEYINNSEYSADSKGDYRGALQTRLEGLTYGIIGNVFNNGDTSPAELFDSNTIVDLSRVGSAETKALLMGLLILKLNEYRISTNKHANNELKHVTVIEEAHNLLKATSTSQSQESANIAGKSVEMIASAIAEMRTFGESFVIADQSPYMLDRSVIRNTNTKVVFALPDYDDRNVASTSFFLNESQTGEISKLPTGIGVVYQKGWEEPVLAHFEKFEIEQANSTIVESHDSIQIESREIDGNLIDLIYDGFTQLNRIYVSELAEVIRHTDMSGKTKFELLSFLTNTQELTSDSYARMMVLFIGTEPFLKAYKEKDIKIFDKIITDAISKAIGNHKHKSTLINAYVKGCSDMNQLPFYDAWLVANK